MALLSEIYTHFRIFVTNGAGLAFLLLLHEAIRVQRPDIVDRNNRVRTIDTSQLLESYDFIVVGGGSAGFNSNADLKNIEILCLFFKIKILFCRCCNRVKTIGD